MDTHSRAAVDSMHTADRLNQATESSLAATSWQREYFSILPELDDLARRRKGVRNLAVMRASQLDAARLDDELTAMLKEHFMRIFGLFQPRIISALQPELALLLDFLIFRFTVWSGRPPPGAALMNLRYRDERAPVSDSKEAMWGRSGLEGPGLNKRQKVLYGLGAVFLRYVWARADQAVASQHWGAEPQRNWGWWCWQGMRLTETGFKLASMVNFIVFLHSGKYRSLLERILGARLVYARGSMARALSFEYLNRQLVWHELSELLLFLLPLLNVARLKSMVLTYLPHIVPSLQTSAAEGTFGGGRQPQSCIICGAAEITVPYTALPCQHRFCYYCLRANTLSDLGYKCHQCGVRVMGMKRWRADQ